MRRLIRMVGLVMVGTLSCLASEHSLKTSTPASQGSCKQTSSPGAAPTPLLLSVLGLPEITALAGEGFSTDDPSDDDKGCCHIAQGTGGQSWHYVTWRECKSIAKAVGDDSPGFEKGKECPSK